MHELLIGTYTGDGSEGIYRYRFEPGSGRIDPESLQVVRSHNPSWLVLDPSGERLFAVNENGAGDPDPIGRVSSFARDPASGELTPIDRVQTLGDHPTHASLSHDGRYLFVANYSAGGGPDGSLAVIPVGSDGRLSPVTQLSSYQASRADPERQLSSHVHSAVVSPDGRFVFASDLGADRVFAYRYDPGNAERPLSPVSPASIELPPGSGPRHMAFSADGKQAYLTLEMASQLVRFDHAEGVLTERQTVDLRGAEKGGSTAPHLSADGRFLYVTDRGDARRILAFAIEADGSLREIQRRPAEGQEPREFALAPDGRHLLVANQLSDEVVVIARDPDSGRLGETVGRLAVSRPSHLLFVAPPAALDKGEVARR
nr:lactonase family protein [Stutzerimonas azotifigens]